MVCMVVQCIDMPLKLRRPGAGRHGPSRPSPSPGPTSFLLRKRVASDLDLLGGRVLGVEEDVVQELPSELTYTLAAHQLRHF
jgi:hypothetical protein